MLKIGIIGGSGLDDPDLIEDYSIVDIHNHWGHPSSVLKTGKIHDIDIVMLSRHGSKHAISPSGVNYRANIWALKDLGVTHIIATTACGSLREEINRGDIVILDQMIDFTRHRQTTFFENFVDGAVHTQMADPFNKHIREKLIDCCRDMNIRHHEKATVITIEGPRFSTRAESFMFRQWGADVINMSTGPECILANEANIPYGCIAISTDYDCWKTDEEPVTFDEILKIFNQNIEKVKKLIVGTIDRMKNL